MVGRLTFTLEADNRANLDFEVDNDGEATVSTVIGDEMHEWPVAEMDIHSLRAFCDEAIRKMPRGVI